MYLSKHRAQAIGQRPSLTDPYAATQRANAGPEARLLPTLHANRAGGNATRLDGDSSE